MARADDGTLAGAVQKLVDGGSLYVAADVAEWEVVGAGSRPPRGAITVTRQTGVPAPDVGRAFRGIADDCSHVIAEKQADGRWTVGPA